MKRIPLIAIIVLTAALSGVAESLTDSRDGKTYKTVKIGEQVWMAENLNYKAMGSFCYEDDASFCEQYGRLYTWDVAQNVCPDGWRLPSESEWGALTVADLQKNLMVPASGFRNSKGKYELGGLRADFWSDGEFAKDKGNYAYFSFKAQKKDNSNYSKKGAMSVRCVEGGAAAEQQVAAMKDSRDGQTYKTVKIGEQVWMAENLNYETENSSCYDKAPACNDSDPAVCKKYGCLYLWSAAMDSAGTWSSNGKDCGYDKTCSPNYPVRGICPEGWHLPTDEEFSDFIHAVGGKETAGKMLKSTSGWDGRGFLRGGRGSSLSDNSIDAFGFSALPAGSLDKSGDLNDLGRAASFWSSTERDSNAKKAYGMGLRIGDESASLSSTKKNQGFSVRCIKD